MSVYHNEMPNNKPIQQDFNHGVIEVQELRPSDWRFNAPIGAKREVLLESRNWEKYLDAPEYQVQTYYDPFNCLTHGDLNAISAVFNRKIELKQFSMRAMQWLHEKGYMVNGKVSFDEQFIATLSKTVCNVGNWQSRIPDAIHTYGLTPQKLGNDPAKYQSCPAYYAEGELEQWQFDLGKEFKQLFQLNFEHVPANHESEMHEAFLYSPVSVLVRAWWENEQGYYYNPPLEDGSYTTNHCVTRYCPATPYKPVQDSYSDYDETPDRKELVPEYRFGYYGHVWFINELTPEPMQLKPNHLYQLVEAPGGIGVAVGDDKLVTVGDPALILATFVMRNNGDTKGKTVSVTKADWDSVPHYDLGLKRVT